jgi:hypothetical protein
MPDGSMLLSDDTVGAIYRISYAAGEGNVSANAAEAKARRCVDVSGQGGAALTPALASPAAAAPGGAGQRGCMGTWALFLLVSCLAFHAGVGTAL